MWGAFQDESEVIRDQLKFLISAVVNAVDASAILEFIERARSEMGTKLIQASFTKLPLEEQLPPVFYMPCPKDGFCVEMEILGSQCQEVYHGTCVNGHELRFVDLDMAEKYRLVGRT